MSAAYTGEGKTDAKDAYVIAETARLRRDLSVVDTGTDLVRELAVLTGHRADLIADRVRMINRLRDLMTSVFPSLERAFDYSSHKGALILLTGYATPDRIRRIGQTRLTSWLRNRHVAARTTCRPRHHRGQGTNGRAARARTHASIITELASAILGLDDRLKALDAQIEATFAEHPQAAIIRSMPGFGPFLGASLLVGANDLRAFPSAGHLAAAAGLVPVPNDSGRRTGNLHRPSRYSRSLRQCSTYRPDQHDARRTQPRLLPQEACPRRHPQPGRHRLGPAPRRRPVGAAAREPNVDSNTATAGSGGLATPLRFPVPGHGPVRDLGRPLADVDHAWNPPAGLGGAGAFTGLAQRAASAQTGG